MNNQRKQLQDSLYILDVLLSNEDISLEEYYTRVYSIEYELECLNDIY
jgi:hypothetical protein